MIGCGKYTGELSAWFAARGHEIRVVTAPPYYPAWKIWKGFRVWFYKVERLAPEEQERQKSVREVRVYRCPLFVPARPSGLKRLLHLASFAFTSAPIAIWQGLWWRPDCIFVVAPTFFCAPAAWLAARFGGSRAWLHIQDFELDASFEVGLLRGKSLRAIATWMERLVLRRYHRVSTISQRMLSKLQEKGVAKDRCVMLANWVNTDRIFPLETPSTFRGELGLKPEDTVVLYSGNMGEKQGLELMLDVARILANVSGLYFVLCGEGAAQRRLQEMAVDLQNVRFLPLQPMERFNDLLNMADIHFLIQRPEIADFVMPSKLTGILAAGGAVIATTHPNTELAKVIADAGGIMVPPGAPHALAEALSDLLKNGSMKLEDIRRRAREYAMSSFSLEVILTELEAKFEALRRRGIIESQNMSVAGIGQSLENKK